MRPEGFPNYADGYVRLANILNRSGRSEKAIRLVEQAIRLNPRQLVWYLFQV
jgi:tetratricopeptide (TPR) repeat protein